MFQIPEEKQKRFNLFVFGVVCGIGIYLMTKKAGLHFFLLYGSYFLLIGLLNLVGLGDIEEEFWTVPWKNEYRRAQGKFYLLLSIGLLVSESFRIYTEEQFLEVIFSIITTILMWLVVWKRPYRKYVLRLKTSEELLLQESKEKHDLAHMFVFLFAFVSGFLLLRSDSEILQWAALFVMLCVGGVLYMIGYGFHLIPIIGKYETCAKERRQYLFMLWFLSTLGSAYVLWLILLAKNNTLILISFLAVIVLGALGIHQLMKMKNQLDEQLKKASKISVECYTEQGRNHVNQDVSGSIENTFWVIDGATPLFGDDLLGGNDVQKVMQEISGAIKAQYSPSCSLVDLLEKAVHQVEQKYKDAISDYESIAKYKLPTFACIMGRIEDHTVSYYAIGDCYLYVNGNVYHDSDFDRINALNEAQFKQLNASLNTGNVLDQDAKRKIVQNTRKLLNREDGYWIGSLDGIGLRHGKSGMIPLAPEGVVYAYSDGFEKMVESVGLEENPHIDTPAFREKVLQNRNLTDDDITVLRIKK